MGEPALPGHRRPSRSAALCTCPGFSPGSGPFDVLDACRPGRRPRRCPDASPAWPPASLAGQNPPPGWDRPHRAGRLRGSRAGVDWSLVARLRPQASERLSAAAGRWAESSRSGGSAGNRPRHHRRPAASQARGAPVRRPRSMVDAGAGRSSRRAVFDALFGLGRLQPLRRMTTGSRTSSSPAMTPSGWS